ncbi:substrate-binding domain-containing protein [Parapedobacter sp. 2B3]|uniref:hybrid sensor histidine kinase/response regulator transcription factor n=1 Tax=Parapedobacter sp. 2B3 TaxID=3342381 RepID=UPI0035B579DA
MSCTTSEKGGKKYRIGFSQCTGDLSWRKATVDALQRELAFHPGAELIYRNAGDNSDLQVEQIAELVHSDIDILLVSPNEAQPLTVAVERVFNRGIPVIVIDRKIASNKFTCYVGTDNYSIGKMAAEYILNTFPDTVNIIEITGLEGSSPTSERSRGFHERIAHERRVRIKASVAGDWLQEGAEAALLKIKNILAPGDIIFAQNDPMVLGAYEVYKSLGYEKEANFVGVDGLPGPEGGIQLVSDKIIQATLLNPTGGEEAIQTAFRILESEPYEKQIILSTVVIDESNVRILKLQTDKIASLQTNIEDQLALLAEQKQLYRSQNIVLTVLVGALVLVLVFGSLSYFALRHKKKANKQLAVQNTAILNQSRELMAMTAKAQEATDAKFNFFTNISHEFRTPLTLILVPIEDTLAASSLSYIHRNNLQLAKKNVLRLLRLVNQLMDFRKLELSKMKIRATENNLVRFVEDITESFSKTAKKKDIHLKVEAAIPEIKLWFDINMMDKVVLNLISNAFKFTGEGGFIGISISRSAVEGLVRIRIQDTGTGMTPEAAAHAFDLFYEGHEFSHHSSGLGLALCKELVELHHGTISVDSEKWRGTCFEVTLPEGRDHLLPEEINTDESNFRMSPDVGIYTADVEPVVLSKPENEVVAKDHSLLIIEDSAELRAFLSDKLGKRFEIHGAATGNAGLNAAYDIIPDVIICDVALPGTDGLAVTHKLKNDILTSHIPIILLSSRDGIHQRIEGMKNKADAFIGKPFNLTHLEETLNSLLSNRDILRAHYTSKLPVEKRAISLQKTDRKFINEFTAIVENNISNEHFGPEYIAQEMHMSRMQLYRKIKSLMGYNVNDYILTVRLQKAKFLLLNEATTISDVAFKTGFSSAAYFSTVFKSKYSITPTEFRSNNEG